MKLAYYNHEIESPCMTFTTISSRQSSSSLASSDDDELNEVALEVGTSAECYLEECFRTEVAVLDRDKFDTVPQLSKHDFAIVQHLGKGSFSDVFEVACDTQYDNELSSQLDGKLKINSSSACSAAILPKRKRDSIRRRPNSRRATQACSVTAATLTLTRPNNSLILAMKCLRPQIRSDVDQFIVGAEDLVHETALLASLDHPNIIKLHGRASGSLSETFVLNDGYFILLDRLSETLTERISRWKLSGPTDSKKGHGTNEPCVARDIAEAMSYLHSKRIVFHDLKPDNVGFDAHGVLKLFDFGLALGLPENSEDNPSGLFYHRAGTPRYMAPEVGLDTVGHGRPADVYSFAVLLWQMFSKEKPFFEIRTAEEFERQVFLQGVRPELNARCWPGRVCSLIESCWQPAPRRRPVMVSVKSTLNDILQSLSEPVAVRSRARPNLARRISVSLIDPRNLYLGLATKN